MSEIVGEHARGAVLALVGMALDGMALDGMALDGMALDGVPARCAGVSVTSQQAGAIAQVQVLSP